MKKVPVSPFATRLSGPGRELEARLRNLFRRRRRPPVLLVALLLAIAAGCGGLVSCQGGEGEFDPVVLTTGGDVSSSAPAPAPAEAPSVPAIPRPDLNQNGVPEEARLVEAYGRLEVQFWEGGELIDREEPGVCIYSDGLGGPDNILRCSLREYQGSFDYQYSVSDFSGEFEETLFWNQVTFDTNFNSLYHKSFAPEEIAGFMDELNELLSHSVRLFEADGELAAEPGGAVDLDWLDEVPDVFTRDPEKSLAENLSEFQRAMVLAQDPAPAGTPSGLPFDEPLTLDFSSGAGAWNSRVVLSPDGSFTGNYSDKDGPEVYVCQFHGRFGDVARLTEHSWSLTLEELALDTRYPLGREWEEGGFHYISSDPNGFSDEEGPLSPGARFLLYSPEAAGHQPGTELYGAVEFQSWTHGLREFKTASDTLGCWGLHNLTTGIGFFSD